MSTADIKNLSIALEALSRFPGTEQYSERIRGLLDDLINNEERTPYTPKPTRTRLDQDDPL